MCLALKLVRYKFYGDLQSFSVLTHQWKNLFIDFVTRLLVSTKWKGKTYNSLLVIVNWLTKIVYYEPVKVTIDIPSLVKVIIKAVVESYGRPDSTVSDCGSVFTSKFWFSLCYFLGIKR